MIAASSWLCCAAFARRSARSTLPSRRRRPPPPACPPCARADWCRAPRRNQAYPALILAARTVPGAYHQQAGELALRAGVGLQRYRRITGDGAQHARGSDQFAIAGGLCRRRERMDAREFGPGNRHHPLVALSFMVQEPSGIIVRSSARSRSASWRDSAASRFRRDGCEYRCVR